MNTWLSDLSEDWVSQPRSSSSPLSGAGSGSSTTHTKSRIPRLRNSSGPLLTNATAEQGSLRRRPSEDRSALREHSISVNNIQLPPGSASKPSKLARPAPGRRSLSASSSQSVVHNGTVEQRPVHASPSRAVRAQDTPEWKRRLIKGNMGYGDQRDLFSPMGLQNIFQQPNGSLARPAGGKKKLHLLKTMDVMPSSPPPWPSTGAEVNESSEKPADDSENVPDSLAHTDVLKEVTSALINTSMGSNADVDGPSQIESSSLIGNINLKHDHALSVDSSVASSEKGRSMNASRAFSGRSDQRDEEFSPVFISKHNTADGRIDYAAMNISRPRLMSQLQRLSVYENDIDLSAVSESRLTEGLGMQSEVLPEDLPAGTPEAVAICNFVNIRRGGLSAEGSFRRRPLSPSDLSQTVSDQVSEVPISGNDRQTQQEESLNTQRQDRNPPPAPSPPAMPSTPSHDRNVTLLNPEKRRSSGSPLKLFGDHDTFTSNRLHRRMSQLENLIVEEKEKDVAIEQSPSRQNREGRLNSVTELSGVDVEAMVKPDHDPTTASKRQTSDASSFGQGELDEYPFPEEISLASMQEDRQSDEIDSSHSPSPTARPLGYPQPFKFRVDSISDVGDTFRGKRKISKLSAVSSMPPSRRNSIEVRKSVRSSTKGTITSTYTLGKCPDNDDNAQVRHTEGKRPPTSPFKNPTPKRRRTLVTLDVKEDTETGIVSVQQRHEQIQSVIGKVPRDVRQGTCKNIADPDVLARRQILRPRNPTPSQRRRQQIEQEILEATEAYISSSPRLEAIMEHLQLPAVPGTSPAAVQAKAVAGEVAAFSVKMATAMKDDSRKRSVTTQDFLDEAMKIMDFIRNKGRPTSGLGSLEESEQETQDGDDGRQDVPSSPLSFSRPPSREGATSGWRSRSPGTVDPRVASHLRKFEDGEDERFLASSVRSLHITQAQEQAPSEVDLLQNQLANVRIIENPNVRGSKNEADTNEGGADQNSTRADSKTHNSHPSVDSSLGRTIVTNGSKRSENVATLAPGAVAHLIPEQIGGMSFDRERGIWVKNKSPRKEVKSPGGVSSLTQSEDDPLGNIPDLTVDEVDELNFTSLSPSRKTTDTHEPNGPNAKNLLEGEGDVHNGSKVDEKENASRPQTREGAEPPVVDTSSAQSKLSHFTSSAAQSDTRATSWSEQQATIRSRKEAIVQEGNLAANRGQEADEVEHEIKIHEDRNAATQKAGTRTIHGVTVSFTSPIVSRKRTSAPEAQETSQAEDDGSDLSLIDSEDEEVSQAELSQLSTSRVYSIGAKPKAVYRGAARQMSLAAKPSASGPIPRIDEHSELSFVAANGQPRINFSLCISQQHDTQSSALAHAPSSPGNRTDVTFYLSDLPEFTLNQINERELPERTLVKRHGAQTVRVTEDRFESGNVALVKAIQDAEPDEPYWEDLRRVNLHGKELTSLHMLEVLCERVEDLDISQNAICQLGGAPFTVRHLNATGNSLSSLTCWNHLVNLQYLDVSGNDIDSLGGFSTLVHLRELRADNNRIESLEGVCGLDGLLRLSLARNKLCSVDFEGANLKRLEDLDLSGNQLENVSNLHCLPELAQLNLDDNRLKAFPTDEHTARPCKKLKGLKLRLNELQTVQCNVLPNLEQLHIDRNHYPLLLNHGNCRKLSVLSVQEQVPLGSTTKENSLVLQSYLEYNDLHDLHMSANLVSCLDMRHNFLNLQRLELASCGLQSLPNNFGQMASNLRVLNLNFNALKDARPLLNIKRLAELSLAGNRLGRLRKTTAVLSKLSTLTKLDLRDNPLSVGFYPPATDNRLVVARENGDEKNVVEDCPDTFRLPPGDKDRDGQFLSRLDEDTKLRRRVYELLLAHGCSKLKVLDGLTFDRRAVMVKDETWEQLLYLGVFKKSGRCLEGIGAIEIV